MHGFEQEQSDQKTTSEMRHQLLLLLLWLLLSPLEDTVCWA
jgi:hypothetical protein